ncbi:MAG: AMP-binding protein [Rickettsiales bacterium]|nr:AMP-binding protein [Rickettsiales bacterium]
MLKTLLKWLLTKLYNIEVRGLENYNKAGQRVVIIANHLSLLDAVLIAVFIQDKPVFAVNSLIAKKWWMKPFLLLVDAYPVDPTNPMTIKSLISEVKKDKKCVIFPEGRITVTGSLMKIYEGPGMIAEKSGATILPIRIDGAQYSPFSYLKNIVRIRWFPKITLTILPPLKLNLDESLSGREKRLANAEKVYDIMTEMMFSSSEYKKTLFQSILEAKQTHGGKHQIILDIGYKPVNYNKLIRSSFALGDQISQDTKSGEYIGFMLPNMASSIMVFSAMQAYGRIPAMLNFASGSKNVISACKTAKVKTVYTSKQFIESAKLETVIDAMQDNNITAIYLEDLVEKIRIVSKIKALFKSKLATSYLRKINKSKPNDPAVVLFTSGSEGTPKAVVLSHTNLQANRFQLSSRVDFSSKDMVLNALPIFHSFGLTAGTLLPLLSGIKTFFYPSPLHYRVIPELSYSLGATIMFGTNSFLAGYAKSANAYDFYSLRYVFAGAEKLDKDVRQMWIDKFGVRIFEGYGATETSPAISTNTPMHNKAGTVGRFMPGIEYKLETIPAIKNGKKLLVKGENIMKGYFLIDKPGILVAPKDGWYDTGDIVDIDEQGYISIKGRAKRFAKIAGEMISLTSVEEYLNDLWSNDSHAVVAIPDKQKGEKLILVTTNQSAKIPEISKYVKSKGIMDLTIPKVIVNVAAIPLLGTGKVDYVKVNNLALGLT